MANVFLIGLEPATASRISRALAVGHRVTRKAETIGRRDVAEAYIVFAGGPGSRYLPLLRRVREQHSKLPFIVVTRVAQTTEWLDALEAGAIDYCCSSVETRQIHWVIVSRRVATA